MHPHDPDNPEVSKLEIAVAVLVAAFLLGLIASSTVATWSWGPLSWPGTGRPPMKGTLDEQPFPQAGDVADPEP